MASKSGVVFPADDKGARSTTAVAKKIWCAALAGVNDELAATIQAEKDWRYKYPRHIGAVGDASLQSAEAAVTIARQGMAAVYDLFEFERDGKASKFAEAFESLRTGSFETGRQEGEGPASAAKQATVPYKGAELTGDALKARLQALARLGSVEASVPAAVESLVAAGPSALDLRGKYFVLLGAGSEMGPMKSLLNFGATVVAIRTRKPGAWTETIAMAKASPGTLIFPVTAGEGPQVERAGCDLLTEAPEVRNWLLEVIPAGADVTVGLYIYLDSDAHVRASVAADAIMNELKLKRSAALAYICSPAVDCLLPSGAAEAMAANRADASWWMKATGAPMPSVSRIATGNRHNFHGFIVAQGPNYALAKTLQNWRAILARCDGDRGTVSCVMGPPTRTLSVLHNSTMKVMVDAMGYIAPNETFDADTSSALLALMLIEDLRNPASPAHPSVELGHPWELFVDKAVHGGSWRAGFDIENSTALSAILYILGSTAPIR